MIDNPTAGQLRTAAATAARRRASEERMASVLRDRGWLTVPPEHVESMRNELVATAVTT